MTDFSRFENTKKVRKPRKPIRWGKIGIVVGTVVFAVVAVTGTALLLEHLVEITDEAPPTGLSPPSFHLALERSDTGLVQLEFGIGVDIDIQPSEPEPTSLTFKKLKAHYDSRKRLTLLQFMDQDAKLKGETVVYFATVKEVTFDYSTFNVRYDHGFVWDEFWRSSERDVTFKDTPKNRAKLLLWNKGTRLKFECVYNNAMNSLAMQPRWKSCIVVMEE